MIPPQLLAIINYFQSDPLLRGIISATPGQYGYGGYGGFGRTAPLPGPGMAQGVGNVPYTLDEIGKIDKAISQPSDYIAAHGPTAWTNLMIKAYTRYPTIRNFRGRILNLKNSQYPHLLGAIPRA